MQQHSFWTIRALFLVTTCLLVFNLALPTNADEPVDNADYALLLDSVQEEGNLRVIVTLALPQPFKAEGYLPERAVVAQHRAIAAAQVDLTRQLSSYQADVYVTYEVFPLMGVEVDEAALKFLMQSPEVVSIEEDVAVPPALLSSTAVIGAPAVWSQGYDGSGQVVVVLDNGMDSDHPFFAGRLPAERCFSKANGASPGVSLCPNGLPSDTSADVETAVCTVSTPGDLCTHGTHVAGIVGGANNGGVPGYDGVAPGTQIIPVQVFTRFNDEGNCGIGKAPCTLSHSSDQLLALQYVLTTLQPTYNVASVNMSLGGAQNFTACDGNSLKTAVDSLLSMGIATIIASGNNGWSDSITAPGCISTAVTVGATNDNDVVASFSNSNGLIDLLAPGVAIDSSVPDDAYDSKQGTSMATPHVAGAWAVLKQAAPTATPAEILAALQQYGINVADYRSGLVRPRIQLDRAVAALQPTVWLGNTTEWNDAANWSTNSLPRCGTPITIPTAPTGGSFPTVNADAAVGKVTIADGATLNMAANTLTVCGDWVAEGTGQFNATGGTVVFASSASQSISLPAGSNGQFYNVQIGDNATAPNVLLNSDIDVDGDLAFLSPATLDANGRTLFVAGDWLDYGSGFMPNDGIVVFNSPTAQSVSNTTIELLNEPFTGAEGQTCCSSALLPAGWVREHTTGFGFLGGRISSTDQNGVAWRWDDSPEAWLHTAGLTLEPGVVYELEYKYRSRSSSTSQDFAVWLGTVQDSANMTQKLHEVLDISSTNFATASATFTVTTSGVYYLGLYSAQNIGAGYAQFDDVIVRATSGSNQFYDVQIDQGTTAFAHDLNVQHDLTIAEGADLTVEGAVANNGRFSQTLNVPNTTTTSFLHIQNAAADEDKYFGLEITPTSGDMDSVEVVIRGGQTCGASGNLNDGIQRCYDITPTTAQTATIRFYYRDAEANGNSAPAVFHYSGSGSVWEPESGITYGGSGEGLWAQATGIDAYSPFALADATPTAVSLSSITTTTGNMAWWLLLVVGLLGGLSLFVYRRRTAVC